MTKMILFKITCHLNKAALVSYLVSFSMGSTSPSKVILGKLIYGLVKVGFPDISTEFEVLYVT